MSNQESETDRLGGEVLRDKRYKDEELLRRLYNEEELTTMEMAEKLDCAQATVRNWMEKYGIERRSISDAVRMGYGHRPNEVPLQTKSTGAVRWNYTYDGEKRTVFVHRLLAVAEYGFDAVRDNVVHHENEIRWDNRPDNMSLMNHSDHSRHHKKLSGLDRIRAAELYENGDCSTYDLAPMFDVAPTTIRYVHQEMYGS